MNDLGQGTKTFEAVAEKHLSEVEGSYTYFANNDVLLAKITPCFENGKLGIARGLKNGVGFGSSEFFVLRASPKLDPEFLYYFLAQDSFRERGARLMTGAVGHKRVPKEFLENLALPLPPMTEQRRAVAILDEAFAGLEVMRSNAEKNLLHARLLFDLNQSALFSRGGEGWKEGPLGKIAGAVFTGPFGSHLHKSDYIKGGTPIINPAHIVDGLIVPEESKSIDKEAVFRLKNYRLQNGDIVIGRRGEIGRCAVITKDEEGWLCGTGSFFIRAFPNTNSFFLAHMLRSKLYREKLERLATGTTMANLSNNSLSAFSIRLPKLERQRQILSEIDSLAAQTGKLESVYTGKLAALAELKQSLLQKAFSGELTASKSVAA